MPSEPLTNKALEVSAADLWRSYARAAFWYLLPIWLLWQLGIEATYQHPLPFYALVIPVFSSIVVPALALALGLALAAAVLGRRGLVPISLLLGLTLAATAAAVLGAIQVAADLDSSTLPELLSEYWLDLRWHLLLLACVVAGLVLLRWALRKVDCFERPMTRREQTWWLIGLVITAAALPVAVAMLRDGMHGVTQAYERQAYEYLSDIGLGGSIRGLFAQYTSVHEHLSMHSKVHPPGPVAILWILSYVAGRDPLGLSVATILFGSLSVVPLYFWVGDMYGRRVGLTAAILFTLVPTIVLFTATSADIAFMPLTLTTLFLFWRAIDRASIAYALGAGLLYGMLSVISFSLVGLGAFFGFVGIWKLIDPATRRAVFQTAIAMLVSVAAFHVAIRAWSGYDVVECFQLCRAQFDLDQVHLDQLEPRWPAWTWKFLNPLCWIFFAGIPVSLLAFRRITGPRLPGALPFVVFGLMFIALDLLYVARGEGERSAMYLMPFLVVPAAHRLDEIGARSRSSGPLLVTALFLVLQTWIMESVLYTYW